MNQFLLLVDKKEGDRLTTVIAGIPYYCSTGTNSKNSGTWFPHRGIITFPKKLIGKPDNELPKEVYDYFGTNIDNDTKDLLKRFGTLQTLCVSASIGGGYWETEQGKNFKHFFLITKYPRFFLEQDTVNQINKGQETQNVNVPSIDITQLDDSKKMQINEKLYQMGAFVLNRDRLPENDELSYFRESLADTGEATDITKALAWLLTKNYKVDNNTYLAVNKLKQQNVLAYALNKTDVTTESKSDLEEMQRNSLFQIASADPSGKKIRNFIELVLSKETITTTDIDEIHQSGDKLRKLQKEEQETEQHQVIETPGRKNLF